MAASMKSSSRTKGLAFYLFNYFVKLDKKESSGSHRANGAAMPKWAGAT